MTSRRRRPGACAGALLVAAVILVCGVPSPQAVAADPSPLLFGTCVLHVPSDLVVASNGTFPASVSGSCKDTQGAAKWYVDHDPSNGSVFFSNGELRAFINPTRLARRTSVTFSRAGAWASGDMGLFCPFGEPFPGPFVSRTGGPAAVLGSIPLYLDHRSPIVSSCISTLLQNQPTVRVVRTGTGTATGDPAARSRTSTPPTAGDSTAGTNGGVGAGPSTTTDVPTDTCRLEAPARIAVSRDYTVVPATLTGACAASGGLGYWHAEPQGGGTPVLTMAGKYLNGAFIDISDTIVEHQGPVTWETDGAWRSRAAFDARHCSFITAPAKDPADPDAPVYPYTGYPSPALLRTAGGEGPYGCTELLQNSPTTDIRGISSARIAASRSGSVVTLGTTSFVYSPSADRLMPWVVTGQFQYRERGSSAWHPLKEVTTARGGSYPGTARIQYVCSRTRDYRFAMYDPGILYFPSTSPVSTA